MDSRTSFYVIRGSQVYTSFRSLLNECRWHSATSAERLTAYRCVLAPMYWLYQSKGLVEIPNWNEYQFWKVKLLRKRYQKHGVWTVTWIVNVWSNDYIIGFTKSRKKSKKVVSKKSRKKLLTNDKTNGILSKLSLMSKSVTARNLDNWTVKQPWKF